MSALLLRHWTGVCDLRFLQVCTIGVPHASRADFYDESCEAASLAETTRRRNTAVGQLPFLVFGMGVLLLGLWHHAQGAATLRDIALIVGGICVGIWMVLRLVR